MELSTITKAPQISCKNELFFPGYSELMVPLSALQDDFKEEYLIDVMNDMLEADKGVLDLQMRKEGKAPMSKHEYAFYLVHTGNLQGFMNYRMHKTLRDEGTLEGATEEWRRAERAMTDEARAVEDLAAFGGRGSHLDNVAYLCFRKKYADLDLMDKVQVSSVIKPSTESRNYRKDQLKVLLGKVLNMQAAKWTGAALM